MERDPSRLCPEQSQGKALAKLNRFVSLLSTPATLVSIEPERLVLEGDHALAGGEFKPLALERIGQDTGGEFLAILVAGPVEKNTGLNPMAEPIAPAGQRVRLGCPHLEIECRVGIVFHLARIADNATPRDDGSQQWPTGFRVVAIFE